MRMYLGSACERRICELKGCLNRKKRANAMADFHQTVVEVAHISTMHSTEMAYISRNSGNVLNNNQYVSMLCVELDQKCSHSVC